MFRTASPPRLRTAVGGYTDTVSEAVEGFSVDVDGMFIDDEDFTDSTVDANFGMIIAIKSLWNSTIKDPVD